MICGGSITSWAFWRNGLAGARTLSECNGRLSWPQRGVYFFMEQGEERSDTGTGRRIVRVGTHALTQGSRTKLWSRLSQHRGQATSGGGNHRGSIFRLIVGTALMARDGHQFPTWGKGSTAPAAIRAGESHLECEVSKVVGAMPILWLAVDDDPGKASLRGYIERNSIALLSNYRKPPLDPASQTWLGHHCNRERVRESGLWNSNHVDEQYDPAFLDRLAQIVEATECRYMIAVIQCAGTKRSRCRPSAPAGRHESHVRRRIGKCAGRLGMRVCPSRRRFGYRRELAASSGAVQREPWEQSARVAARCLSCTKTLPTAGSWNTWALPRFTFFRPDGA